MRELAPMQSDYRKYGAEKNHLPRLVLCEDFAPLLARLTDKRQAKDEVKRASNAVTWTRALNPAELPALAASSVTAGKIHALTNAWSARFQT